MACPIALSTNQMSKPVLPVSSLVQIPPLWNKDLDFLLNGRRCREKLSEITMILWAFKLFTFLSVIDGVPQNFGQYPYRQDQGMKIGPKSEKSGI